MSILTETATQTTSPELFFENVFAFQRTAALKTAIALDLFTAIATGAVTASQIATACGASERGVRQLSDYLTAIGFLRKTGDQYQLTPDSAMFLSKRSPAYLGGTLEFLASPTITSNFEKLTETVRRGTVTADSNTVADEHPVWAAFARAMTPMMMPAAQGIADLIDLSASVRPRILDIAAGHGIFGITLAQRNPSAEVVAVDWAHVLAVATEHARQLGVADRYRTIPGDAFKVDFGSGYDVALVTNFLHHFDRDTCTGFMKKVAGALKAGGRVAVLEFVPNEDRVSPVIPATFVLNMLASTETGDVYTFEDLRGMLSTAGFRNITAHALPTPQTVVLGTKE